MLHVQLIEKISIPDGLWLTFWDLDEHRQISIELSRPIGDYKVGQVFHLDDSQSRERLTLRLIDDVRLIAQLDTIIDVPARQSTATHPSAHVLSYFGVGDQVQIKPIDDTERFSSYLRH